MNTITIRLMSCAELDAMVLPPIAPEPAMPPTWQELVAVEPRLAVLETLALMLHRPEGDSCWRWSRIKQALLPLVGFEAEKFAIRHLAGYDVACDHLLTCLETGRRPEATDSAMQEVCPVNDVYEFDPELQAVYSGAHQYLAAAVARRWIAEHPEKIVGSVQSIKADFEADVHRYVRLSRFRELLVEAGYKIDRNDRPRQ